MTRTNSSERSGRCPRGARRSSPEVGPHLRARCTSTADPPVGSDVLGASNRHSRAPSPRLRTTLAMVVAIGTGACQEKSWEFSVNSAFAIADSLWSTRSVAPQAISSGECPPRPDSDSSAVAARVLDNVASHLLIERLGFSCAARLVSQMTDRGGTIVIDDANDMVFWRNGTDPDDAQGTALVGLFYEQGAEDTATMKNLWPVVVGLEGMRAVLERADTTTDVVVTVSNIALWSGGASSDVFVDAEPESYQTYLATAGAEGPVPPAMFASAPGWVVGSSPHRIADGASSFLRPNDPSMPSVLAADAPAPSDVGTNSPHSPDRFVANEFQPLVESSDTAVLEARGDAFVQAFGPLVDSRGATDASSWDPKRLIPFLWTVLSPVFLVLAACAVTWSLRRRRKSIEDALSKAKYPEPLQYDLFAFSKHLHRVGEWVARMSDTGKKLKDIKIDIHEEVDEVTRAIQRETRDIAQQLTELPELVEQLGEVPARNLLVRSWRWTKKTLLKSPSPWDPKFIIPHLDSLIRKQHTHITNCLQPIARIYKSFPGQVPDSLDHLRELAGAMESSMRDAEVAVGEREGETKAARPVEPEDAAKLWTGAEKAFDELKQLSDDTQFDDAAKKRLDVIKEHIDALDSLVPATLPAQVETVLNGARAMDESLNKSKSEITQAVEEAIDAVRKLEEGQAAISRSCRRLREELARNAGPATRGKARMGEDETAAEAKVTAIVEGMDRRIGGDAVSGGVGGKKLIDVIEGHCKRVRKHVLARIAETKGGTQLSGEAEESLKNAKRSRQQVEREVKKFCPQSLVLFCKRKLGQEIRKRVGEVQEGIRTRLGHVVASGVPVTPVVAGVVTAIVVLVVLHLVHLLGEHAFVVVVGAAAAYCAVGVGLWMYKRASIQGGRNDGERTQRAERKDANETLVWYAASGGLVWLWGMAHLNGATGSPAIAEAAVSGQMIVVIGVTFSMMLAACQILASPRTGRTSNAELCKCNRGSVANPGDLCTICQERKDVESCVESQEDGKRCIECQGDVAMECILKNDKSDAKTRGGRWRGKTLVVSMVATYVVLVVLGALQLAEVSEWRDLERPVFVFAVTVLGLPLMLVRMPRPLGNHRKQKGSGPAIGLVVAAMVSCVDPQAPPAQDDPGDEPAGIVVVAPRDDGELGVSVRRGYSQNGEPVELAEGWSEDMAAQLVGAVRRNDEIVRDKEGQRTAVVTVFSDSWRGGSIEVTAGNDSVTVLRVNGFEVRGGRGVKGVTRWFDSGVDEAITLWVELPRCEPVDLLVKRRYVGGVAERLSERLIDTMPGNAGFPSNAEVGTMEVVSELRQTCGFPTCCAPVSARSEQCAADRGP